MKNKVVAQKSSEEKGGPVDRGDPMLGFNTYLYENWKLVNHEVNAEVQRLSIGDLRRMVTEGRLILEANDKGNIIDNSNFLSLYTEMIQTLVENLNPTPKPKDEDIPGLERTLSSGLDVSPEHHIRMIEACFQGIDLLHLKSLFEVISDMFDEKLLVEGVLSDNAKSSRNFVLQSEHSTLFLSVFSKYLKRISPNAEHPVLTSDPLGVDFLKE
ncbi:MAG: hypothetical protein AABZ14_02285 [Candidatus Margulisiibacteriota bacterium]